MRIGVFTNVLAHRPSGIGWHVINLLNHLARIDQHNEYFLFYRVTRARRGDSRFKPDAPNFHNVPVVAPDLFYSRFFRVWDRHLLPRAIARHRLDLFHGPNHYLPPRSNIPQVVTYHDLAEAKFQLSTPAEQHAQQLAARNTLARADRVIAISQCTRDDVAHFGFPPEKIALISQGGNFDGPQHVDPNVIEAAKRAFGVVRPYVLFVSSLVPRKNVSFLLHAMAKLKSTTPDMPQLVLAGASDTPEAARLKAQAQSLGIAADTVFTGYLNNNQVRGLYGGARLVAIPSLYEGFGMPALEAMAYGVPVVSARAGALPEVVADAGLLVNLGDEPALADAIARLLRDNALHADLAARGRQRIAAFSWDQTARQTLALYQTLAP